MPITHARDGADTLQEIANVISKSRKILVVTGAGISTNAGIPDFRSEHGLYSMLQAAYEMVDRPHTDAPLDAPEPPAKRRRLGSTGAMCAGDPMPAQYVTVDTPPVSVGPPSSWVAVNRRPTQEPVTVCNAVASGRVPSSSSSNNSSYPRSRGKDMFDQSIWSDSAKIKVFYTSITKLRQQVSQANPTASHYFIKHLKTRGKLVRCYTQNIDQFEERVGLDTSLEKGPGRRSTLGQSQPGVDCVQLHGSLRWLRCHRCHKACEWDENLEQCMLSGEPPACPFCEGVAADRTMRGKRALGIGKLRPDIVLYGEEHPQAALVSRLIESDISARASLLIIMGTSLHVQGLKYMIREFARAVHSKRGKVVFVNLTRPAESVWKDIIDYWVEMDCDEWAEDLKRRKPVLWSGVKPSTKPIVKPPASLMGCWPAEPFSAAAATSENRAFITQLPWNYRDVSTNIGDNAEVEDRGGGRNTFTSTNTITVDSNSNGAGFACNRTNTNGLDTTDANHVNTDHDDTNNNSPNNMNASTVTSSVVQTCAVNTINAGVDGTCVNSNNVDIDRVDISIDKTRPTDSITARTSPQSTCIDIGSPGGGGSGDANESVSPFATPLATNQGQHIDGSKPPTQSLFATATTKTTAIPTKTTNATSATTAATPTTAGPEINMTITAKPTDVATVNKPLMLHKMKAASLVRNIMDNLRRYSGRPTLAEEQKVEAEKRAMPKSAKAARQPVTLRKQKGSPRTVSPSVVVAHKAASLAAAKAPSVAQDSTGMTRGPDPNTPNSQRSRASSSEPLVIAGSPSKPTSVQVSVASTLPRSNSVQPAASNTSQLSISSAVQPPATPNVQPAVYHGPPIPLCNFPQAAIVDHLVSEMPISLCHVMSNTSEPSRPDSPQSTIPVLPQPAQADPAQPRKDGPLQPFSSATPEPATATPPLPSPDYRVPSTSNMVHLSGQSTLTPAKQTGPAHRKAKDWLGEAEAAQSHDPVSTETGNVSQWELECMQQLELPLELWPMSQEEPLFGASLPQSLGPTDANAGPLQAGSNGSSQDSRASTDREQEDDAASKQHLDADQTISGNCLPQAGPSETPNDQSLDDGAQGGHDNNISCGEFTLHLEDIAYITSVLGNSYNGHSRAAANLFASLDAGLANVNDNAAMLDTIPPANDASSHAIVDKDLPQTTNMDNTLLSDMDCSDILTDVDATNRNCDIPSPTVQLPDIDAPAHAANVDDCAEDLRHDCMDCATDNLEDTVNAVENGVTEQLNAVKFCSRVTDPNSLRSKAVQIGPDTHSDTIPAQATPGLQLSRPITGRVESTSTQDESYLEATHSSTSRADGTSQPVTTLSRSVKSQPELDVPRSSVNCSVGFEAPHDHMSTAELNTATRNGSEQYALDHERVCKVEQPDEPPPTTLGMQHPPRHDLLSSRPRAQPVIERFEAASQANPTFMEAIFNAPPNTLSTFPICASEQVKIEEDDLQRQLERELEQRFLRGAMETSRLIASTRKSPCGPAKTSVTPTWLQQPPGTVRPNARPQSRPVELETRRQDSTSSTFDPRYVSPSGTSPESATALSHLACVEHSRIKKESRFHPPT